MLENIKQRSIKFMLKYKRRLNNILSNSILICQGISSSVVWYSMWKYRKKSNSARFLHFSLGSFPSRLNLFFVRLNLTFSIRILPLLFEFFLFYLIFFLLIFPLPFKSFFLRLSFFLIWESLLLLVRLSSSSLEFSSLKFPLLRQFFFPHISV